MQHPHEADRTGGRARPFGRARSRFTGPLGTAAAVLLGLAACHEQVPPVKPVLAVHTEVVRYTDHQPTIVLTGEIRAAIESDLSFRTSGRIAERKVEVGAHVAAGQELARLDPQEQLAGLDAAAASVQAAEAQLRQAASTYDRQRILLARGFTTRRESDQSEEAYRTAQASVEAANAQLATARDQLSFTILRAAAPGIVTARAAEAGQVVQAAQAVFTLAQDGPRDAVFDVYEAVLAQPPVDGVVEVTLIGTAEARATGRVREVSPSVDPKTGTVRVKVGLNGASPAMPLGAAVTGTARVPARPVVALPAGALSSLRGTPAVWVVDAASGTVSATPVQVDSYATGTVLVAAGLEPGAVVVTAGAQLLRPGQPVTASGDSR